MAQLNKRSIILGVITTALMALVSYGFCQYYAPAIIEHRQLSSSWWSILALLFCLPGIVASIGMALRKAWSLPLAAFLVALLAILSLKDLLANLSIHALYPQDIIFLSLAIAICIFCLYLFLFTPGVKSYFRFPSSVSDAKSYLKKHRFFIATCLIFLFMAQVYLAKQYQYYQQYPWPPPEIANNEPHKNRDFFVKGEIDPHDIDELISIVNNTPGIDKSILFIDKRDSKILITTGELLAPLWGSGFKLLLQKNNNQWEVLQIAEWIS